MIKELMSLAFVLCAFTGCSGYRPLPVEEPPAKDEKNQRTVPDYQRRGLTPAVNLEQAIENLKIYGDSYQGTADKLRGSEYASSDFAVGGGVLGVIGGLAESFGTAAAGALIASGSSVVSQRYQFLVQADNYEKGSDAMYCMYTRLYSEEELRKRLNQDVDFLVFVNERVDEIRRRLRRVQANVQLASPDMAKLETALGESFKNKKNKDEASALLDQKKFQKAKSDAELEAFNKARIESLKSDLTKCVASF